MSCASLARHATRHHAGLLECSRRPATTAQQSIHQDGHVAAIAAFDEDRHRPHDDTSLAVVAAKINNAAASVTTSVVSDALGEGREILLLPNRGPARVGLNGTDLAIGANHQSPCMR
jgi:hypothetical protein